MGLATRLLSAFAFALLAAGPAWGNSHLWRISELFSNADGSVQFIEMQEIGGSDIEFELADKWFITNSKQFVFPNDLEPGTAFKRFLMATQGFAALPGAPTPDFIIPDAFFNPAGDTLLYFVYDSFTIPSGSLPTDGTQSMQRSDLATGPNSPTNYAGGSGSVVSTPPTCSLALRLRHVGAGLILSFELGSSESVVWNVWLSIQSSTILLWSVPLPALEPPVTLPVSLPFPQIGRVGVLTSLTTSDGILCSDWESLDTGA